jgi:DNA-binding HxlR family transcriptional regulator
MSPPPSGSRSYGQQCGVARALDLLGERWTLLLIRELMRGPKRFKDLQDGLGGIGTNLLSSRLKSLEETGVVERTTLPSTVPVPGYALTARGEALRPALSELALWGFDLLDPDGLEELRSRSAWAAMTMCAQMDRDQRRPPDGIFGFEVGDERFWLRVAGGRSTLRDGAPPLEAEASLAADRDAFFAIAAGVSDPDSAGAEITGDRQLMLRLFETFRLPPAPWLPSPGPV